MSSITSKTKQQKKSLKQADNDKVINEVTSESVKKSKTETVNKLVNQAGNEVTEAITNEVLDNTTVKSTDKIIDKSIDKTINEKSKIDKSKKTSIARATTKDSALNNKKVIFDMLTEIVNTYKPKSVIKISNLLKDRGYDYSEHRIRTLLNHANIHKIYDEQGERYYKVLNEKSLANKDNLIYNFIASINHNTAMIVIKTTIAGAPLVAKLIDFNSHQLDVLGTIAGDDTVLIIPRHVSECEETFNKIYNFLMK